MKVLIGMGQIVRIKGPHDERSKPSKVVEWRTTQCSGIASATQHSLYMFQGESMITKNGDNVRLSCHVIFTDSASSSGHSIGCVLEILIGMTDKQAVEHVAIQLLQFSPTLHSKLHLPCLTLVENKRVICPSVSFIASPHGFHTYFSKRMLSVQSIYSTIASTPIAPILFALPHTRNDKKHHDQRSWFSISPRACIFLIHSRSTTTPKFKLLYRCHCKRHLFGLLGT